MHLNVLFFCLWFSLFSKSLILIRFSLWWQLSCLETINNSSNGFILHCSNKNCGRNIHHLRLMLLKIMQKKKKNVSFDFGVKWFTSSSTCTSTQVLDWCVARWFFHAARDFISSLWVEKKDTWERCKWRRFKAWWRVIYGRC